MVTIKSKEIKALIAAGKILKSFFFFYKGIKFIKVLFVNNSSILKTFKFRCNSHLVY